MRRIGANRRASEDWSEIFERAGDSGERRGRFRPPCSLASGVVLAKRPVRVAQGWNILPEATCHCQSEKNGPKTTLRGNASEIFLTGKLFPTRAPAPSTSRK